MSPDQTAGLVLVVAAFFAVHGAWMLMRGVGSTASKLLFGSLAALLVWVPSSGLVKTAVFYYSDLSKPTAWENAIYVALEFVPAFFVVVASLAFWGVARSIGRPNISLKRTNQSLHD
jgi:hypothetical protein